MEHNQINAKPFTPAIGNFERAPSAPPTTEAEPAASRQDALLQKISEKLDSIGDGAEAPAPEQGSSDKEDQLLQMLEKLIELLMKAFGESER